jgi:DNA-binding response OmpR family regulator
LAGVQDPHTVLLVEDETLVRETVAFGLEDEGFHVVAVANAGAALDAFGLDGCEVSCLVTNIDLGATVDGFELARRAVAKKPGLKVVYITGGSRHRSAEMVPGGKLMAKPFTVDELAECVRAMVGL